MSATKIVLINGAQLVVSMALEDVQTSIHRAIENRGWVRINGEHNVSINPDQVAYLEEVTVEDGATEDEALFRAAAAGHEPVAG